MKHILTFIALVLATACLGQVPTYVPNDGLIGYYSLNGNANDDGPQASDGQLHGPVGAVDRFGEDGGCIAFDGLDDFGSIPHSPGWNNLPGLSVSLWFNWESHPTNYQYCGGGTGTYSALVNKWASSNESRTFELMLTDWGLGSTPSESGYLSACHSGGCWDNVESWDDFPLNSWNHLCVVYGEDSGSVYVNGVVHHSSATLATPDGLPSAGNEILFGDFPNVSCDRSFDGLMDDLAFWNRSLSSEEVMTLFLGEAPVMGCINPQACNFNAEANVNDGSCYSCEIPAAHCGEGTTWDFSSQTCIISNPSDTDFDGCVSMTDLLDLLTVFGTCVEEELEEDPEVAEWSCGDPLEYQGYDYETVQIGEQCWFAENCRHLPSVSSSSQGSYLEPHAYVHGFQGSNLMEAMEDPTYSDFGVLYNQPASVVWACPTSWHVPSDEDWIELELFLGIEEPLDTLGYRGTNQGNQLKASSNSMPPWNGTDDWGFRALPGQYRGRNGNFGNNASEGRGYYWSSTVQDDVSGVIRVFDGVQTGLYRGFDHLSEGFSVRCIQNVE